MASWWDSLVIFFTGKHVAIVGPRDAGKTTLYDFFEHGTVVPQQPRRQTVAPTNRRSARRKDLDLSVKKGVDLPGSDVHYPDWERLVKDADIVFYVFDAHLARTADAYARRMSQDGRKLKEWQAGKKEVHLIGTHRDTDPLFRECAPAEYADLVLELDVVEAMRSRLSARSVVVGNLSSDEEARQLMQQVIKQ